MVAHSNSLGRASIDGCPTESIKVTDDLFSIKRYLSHIFESKQLHRRLRFTSIAGLKSSTEMCLVFIFERRPLGKSRFPSLWQRFLGYEQSQTVESPVMTPTSGRSEDDSKKPLLPPRPDLRVWESSSHDLLGTRRVREDGVPPSTPPWSASESHQDHETSTQASQINSSPN